MTTPETFSHPGLLNSELEMIHWAVLAGRDREPESSALQRLTLGETDLGVHFLEHQPQPGVTWSAVVHWSSPGDARRLLDDARAAYACALLWRSGAGEAYAAKAIEIIDGWSSTLTTILNSAGKPASPSDARQDYMLYTSYSWPAMIWAAEILRHSPGSGWSTEGQQAFAELLRVVVRPAAEHPANNLGNNWRSWRICFKISCAVHLDETAPFRAALEEYRAHVSNYISDDLSGEMERDLWHSQMGLGPLVLAAEIALKQGIDLFSHHDNLLLRSLEYQIPFILGDLSNWPSGWTYKPGHQWDGSNIWPMYEFSHHHYAIRRGLDLPAHGMMLNKPDALVLPSLPSPRLDAPNQPRPYRAEDFYRVGYGTLTHGSSPLAYPLLCGFDRRQSHLGDPDILVEANGGSATVVQDPTPGQGSNGVLHLAHPSGAPVRIAKDIGVSRSIEVSMDYRFNLPGSLVLALDAEVLTVLDAPDSGPGRDAFTRLHAVFNLDTPALNGAARTFSVRLLGPGPTALWIDNLIVTTPVNQDGIPSHPYLAWVADQQDLRGPDALPMANPDGDSANNLFEYAFDSDPRKSGPALQRLALHPFSNSPFPEFSFPCDDTRSDLVYTVEVSGTLSQDAWSPVARSLGGLPFEPLNGSGVAISDPGHGKRTVSVSMPSPPDGSALFYRLRLGNR